MTPHLSTHRVSASELADFLRSHPDPFDWMRTHRVTQTGDPERFTRYRDLPMRYTATMRADRDNESLVPWGVTAAQAWGGGSVGL